jgi:hypothetical protein
MLQSFKAATLSCPISWENEATPSTQVVVQAVSSLPIPRPPRPRRTGFLLARVGTMLGTCVPPLPLVVPNHRRKIQPNDDILRTMLLRLGFVGECLERKRGNRQRQTGDQAHNEFRHRAHGTYRFLPTAT